MSSKGKRRFLEYSAAGTLMLMLALTGCCPRIPPPCVLDEPPTMDGLAIAGPEGGCPPPFDACLTHEAAVELDRQRRATARWMREAWERCR